MAGAGATAVVSRFGDHRVATNGRWAFQHKQDTSSPFSPLFSGRRIRH